ncbi:MAG: glycoside hydrolase TIM-barrel-like domain-containing protein, partial [Parvularculaceae bacterium]|nr:glycoside hydrolase TIM-barrel-like domain-containing protein [Parvularculaceae bacterium]
MDAPGYPWRGRIGVGAADKTAAAATKVGSFFGTASRAHFSVAGGEVSYAGPTEWSFRRFILHCAHLCAAAGGVESFLLGSELVGVTTARSGASTYPAVAAMRALAAEVRAVLGPATKVSYAADWTEWRGHQPTDGSGDVFFHLDPLWADANIDFIGVDMYAPRADWRDGAAHADAGKGGPHDRAYLSEGIEGGEGYDWYYGSDADRAAQTRRPITDGAYGEPWVFRVKDVRDWWSSAHHDRPAGVRAATPTAWSPHAKPIRFAEFGAAAIDKAANQPNVFGDPKSVENARPYFSSGARDDLAQRRLIEAELAWQGDPARNPTSSVYGGPMIEGSYAYCWDARPFPFFPARRDLWGDAPQWARGHWLNG